MNCADLKRIIEEYKANILTWASFEQLLKQAVSHHDDVCDSCGEQLGEDIG